jgi:hypothetical protein
VPVPRDCHSGDAQPPLRSGGAADISDAGTPDEKPVHTVTVSALLIATHEVTQMEWRELMGTDPSEYKGDGGPTGNIADESARKHNPGWRIWFGYDDGYAETAPADTRVSNRAYETPAIGDHFCGFRLARSRWKVDTCARAGARPDP